MKVTAALKKELTQWLDTYWTTYIKGDIETWANFIRDDYRNIGGTREEIWNSKQEIIDYTKSIMDQMIGTVEIRNREIEVIPYGEYMMVNEFTDLYVKIEGEWMFYGPFRMSSLLEKIETGWIALHQHGSYPDMKAMEGEAFSVDAMKAENAKLQDAVKKRTAELENKNRELAIEAALEKVRAVAMGMKKPEDMLDVCRVISEQLQDFGVKHIRNVQTAIIDENIGQYLCYQYFTPYGKIAVEKTDYHKSPVEHGMVRQMLASRDGYFIGGLSGKELEDFRSHRHEENHFPDPLLEEATELDYCFLSIGEGGLGLTLYQPMDQEVLTLFKRFHQVFSLAYQRFRDIQKAQSQAREAQIEAAVERVRAEAMAMHSTRDFEKVTQQLLKQVKAMTSEGFTGASICLIDENHMMNWWDFSSPGNIGTPESQSLRYDAKEFKILGREVLEKWQEGDSYMVFEYNLDQLQAAVKEWENINVDIANAFKEALLKGKLTHQWNSCGRISNGLLSFDMLRPPDDDVRKITIKMAHAFDQAYTRFLDLQKAEDQAREAKIEAALERVRSISLAMHHTDELQSVIHSVHQELLKLKLSISGGSFITINSEIDTEIHCWGSGGTADTSNEVHIPRYDKPFYTHLLKGIKKGPGFFTEEYTQEDKIEFFTFLFQHEPWSKLSAKEKKETLNAPGGYTRSCVVFQHTSIFIINHFGKPFSEDENAILRRFGKVFEQSYTRFLDLQKAEAQAREAQVNLAVERVRARALAMFKSEEILHVVNKLKDEIMGLDIPNVATATIHLKEPDGTCRVWDLTSLELEDEGLHLPLDIRFRLENTHPDFFMRRVWENEADYFVVIQEEADFKHTIQWLRDNGLNVQANETEEFFESTQLKKVYHPTVPLNNGRMCIDLLDTPAHEVESILKKMAGAFDLAYKRFEDLQKAEAQAKEAQIELSLERIRSQVTAMQESSDLLDIVVTMRTEFVKLGHEAHYFWHMRWLLERYEKAMTSGDGTRIGMVMTLPRHIHGDIPLVADWEKSDKPTVILAMEADTAVEYVHKMITLGDFEQVDPQAPTLDDIRHIGGLTFVMARTIHGEIGFSLPGAVTNPSKDAVDTLVRFAGVFDLAYKRFEDLKAAERQHREAKIELALERVRARTMAMQKSTELNEVASVLFEQIRNLGGALWGTGFALCNVSECQDEFWFANEAGVMPPVKIPNTEDDVHIAMLKGWTEKREYLLFQKEGDALASHYKYMNSLPQVKAFFEPMLEAGHQFPTWQQWHAAYFLQGYLLIITVEPYPEPEIFKRFAKVFDQTYTRFLDLQNAEKQGREAEIQLALERVRARSMAMHKSEELADLSLELVKQVQGLGVETWFCAFNIYDDDHQGSLEWGSNGQGTFPQYRTPREGVFLRYYEAGQRGETLFINEIGENECPAHYEYLCTLPGVGDQLLQMKAAGIPFPSSQIDHVAFFKYGYLLFITFEPAPTAHPIFKRFAKVFEQTYTRFLDLQKAEAQAREAQIEAALERTRTQSMLMQHSGELNALSKTFHEQLLLLGINSEFSFVWLPDEANMEHLFWATWLTNEDGASQYQSRAIKYPLDKTEPGTAACFAAWGSDEPVHETFVPPDEIDAFFASWEELLLGAEQLKPEFFREGIYYTEAYMKYGCFGIDIRRRLTLEEKDIIRRFAVEFERSYTRFLDLQKAEAQAREAQIEAALERVRSNAMAMQSSNDLNILIGKVFAECTRLDIQLDRGIIMIYDTETMNARWWMANPEAPDNPRDFFIQHHHHAPNLAYLDAWKNKFKRWTYVLEGEEKKDWDEFLFFETDLAKLPSEVKQIMMEYKTVYLNATFNNFGNLTLATLEPLSDSHFDILLRFGRVFDMTYTRFNDLKQAEAQAREARIEAALEKVRSRTMGMQSSEELPEVANLMFLEVQALGIPAWSCGYCILLEDRKSSTCIMSSEGTLQKPFLLPHYGEVSFDEWDDFIQGDETFFTQELGGNAIESHYKFMKSLPQLTPIFKEIEEAGLSLPTYQINHLCKFSYGFLLFITYEAVEGSHDIFKRFTNVFDQTYTRFLDLKKAEAQAREARIENALEKVRSRSLAMQSPDELIEVAQLLREEMGALGVEELETSSIYIHDDSSGLTQCWFTIKNTEDPGKAVTDQMTMDLGDTWVGRKMYEFYRSSEKQTSILMQGEQRVEWIRYCEEKSDLFTTTGFYGETIPERTYHLYKFSNGYIGAASPGEISNESWELLKRATAVFSFAYTRFRDLQMAEASARASMRQASLDRVRADISSMRNADDLDRITPLVFNELTTLGIPFIRCGVFIVQEKNKNVEVYLSTPEGKSLAVMTLPFNANEMTARSVEAWKKEEVYVQHWDQSDFVNWSKSLQEQGHVKDLNTYQDAEAAPESLHLHFIPFSQGLLYVGSTEKLGEEQIELVKALAKSFAIAYARFEDFVKLEQAKAEVESAMSELKSTQSQLVQQEKLASLGQLTAGIAHEIKNPLNFVNNFSEVSMEMIEEILEARSERREAREKNQDTRIKNQERDESEEMEKEILEDIKGNLKKIHEHGSRANGIVTSMLQHSRGGSGKKEPTDINALIREYSNLAFHGMRAGKNPINVAIDLQLDMQIRNVPLVGEDFSRVLLNLCNNAFDAMRTIAEIRPPKLTIRTKLQAENILIEVEDNGPGIPDEIKDKILQPFFTTKKGTEGTGLGLSITHDIVKAHGGEIKVNTKENEGTEFTIQLPIS